MDTTPRPLYRSIDDVLVDAVLTPSEVDEIAAAWPEIPGTGRWRRDPDVGLVERSYFTPNGGSRESPVLAAGHEGTSVTATIEGSGARWMSRYGDVPPRINSYGDSFTHGDQVNDGETWQEYLAAHFREPIRNFGLGGGSTYQAYLRMLKEEATEHAADNVLLFFWGDDHIRSIVGGSSPVVGLTGKGFFARLGLLNPFLSIDVETGAVVEHPNPVRRPEDLSLLADPEWLHESYTHDLVAQLLLFGGHPNLPSSGGRIATIDENRIAVLAEILDFGAQWRSATDRRAAARELIDRYSLRTSTYVVERSREYAEANGKRVMFLLLDPLRSVRSLIDSGTRYDQAIIDHLDATGSTHFDMSQYSAEEIRARSESFDDHFRRYYVGHYNPAGNHLFAFALAPHLVTWLDPAPAPYRTE